MCAFFSQELRILLLLITLIAVIILTSPNLTSSSCLYQELQILEDDAQIIKLVGPVLVKQELVEVKSNVTTRIEYIKSDLTRLEGLEKAKAAEQEKCGQQIQQLQKGGQ